MNIKRVIIGFVILSFAYISVVVYLAVSGRQAINITATTSLFLLLCTTSLLSFTVRLLRWYWLLNLAGIRIPYIIGSLAYLAGFAFTMVPGKLGELIRIRYFSRLGVPNDIVISAFLFERITDLLAVLSLACLLINNPLALGISAGFVFLIVGTVCLLAFNIWPWAIIAKCIKSQKASRLISVLQDGFQGVRRWLGISVLAPAFGLGLLAWGLVALGFVMLLDEVGIKAAFWPALAVYPSAMLVGAASLLPGGILSTEGAITIQLMNWGASTEIALFVAVLIRMSTLWFAILIGFVSVLVLENERLASHLSLKQAG